MRDIKNEIVKILILILDFLYKIKGIMKKVNKIRRCQTTNCLTKYKKKIDANMAAYGKNNPRPSIKIYFKYFTLLMFAFNLTA